MSQACPVYVLKVIICGSAFFHVSVPDSILAGLFAGLLKALGAFGGTVLTSDDACRLLRPSGLAITCVTCDPGLLISGEQPNSSES